MITCSEPFLHSRIKINSIDSWQEQLSQCITDPLELLDMLGLSLKSLSFSMDASKEFLMKVPRSFANRMEYNNPNDPLLLQVLPIKKEMEVILGYSSDPLNETISNKIPGIVHKYQGRVLLLTSQACAVNCRFCFRRHFAYQENKLTGSRFDDALEYINNNTSIKEVILSGGDPLAASDKYLERIIQSIDNISHVSRLRIHSRMPIVLPNRITTDLVNRLTNTRLQVVMVVHCNHANEIDDDVRDAMQKLKMANISIFNQTVLLKQVNNNASALIQLSEKLFDAGVIPYYLHLLDKVQGAAHFDVSQQEAKSLIKTMMSQCSGYLVPRLVREIAGQPNKSWIALD